MSAGHPTIMNMSTIPPAASPAAPSGSAAAQPRRNRTKTVVLTTLCVLAAFASAGQHAGSSSTAPEWLQTYASIGAFVMVGVSVLLIWRQQFPIAVSTIAVIATILFPTTLLPALIAIATVTATHTGWKRWLLVAGTYVAVMVSLIWDLTAEDSFLSGFFQDPAAGTPARLSLFWSVPVVAAIAVFAFAGYGILRRVQAQRDAAALGTEAATRNVAVLRQEVQREHDRQELARELHDTLAARLSSLSLQAGALEIAAEGQTTEAARAVRESAQASLDDLRQVVRVLRDPERAGPSNTGLADITQLIDAAVAEGVDVRAQLLLTDPSSCDPNVAHACYRLVQESISNAKQHAPGSAFRIDIRAAPTTGVSVTTANWLGPEQPPHSTGGHGLIGMNERVTMVGGSFQAGPTPERTFAIIAWMPWAPT